MKKLYSPFTGFFLLFIACFITQALYAGDGTSNTRASTRRALHSNEWLLRENAGQLKDQNQKSLPEVKYYGKHNGVHFYCKPGMISFVFTKLVKDTKVSGANGSAINKPIIAQRLDMEADDECRIISSRLDFAMLNANPNSQIIAGGQQDYYENYYTGGSQGTVVHSFTNIIYKDIYPHIDMLISLDKGMEYSFTVHPGGNIADIKLQWLGADKTEGLEDGSVRYSNALGYMQESAPVTYCNKSLISSRFSRNGGVYGFAVGDYDKTKDLVIDPTLYWATYYGGSDMDEAFDITSDIYGNHYVVGATLSTDGIATSGAYDTSNAGHYDVFLSRFLKGEYFVWTTYYGGEASDYGKAVAVDNSGYIYITGYTASTTGIASADSRRNKYTGGSLDAFLTKFDWKGNIIWGSYFGGSSTDEGLAVCTDNVGFVYITGATYSSDSIANYASYQRQYAGSGTDEPDAFVAKFNGDGYLHWSTYYGGIGEDVGYGICVDAQGYVYITGYTASTGAIASDTIVHQSNYGGGNYDAFVARFTSVGALSWGTYLGGAGSDIARRIKIDSKGDLYITGGTNSDSGIATENAYNSIFTSNADEGFLAKFDHRLGQLKWATYFGGDSSVAYGLSIDPLNNIYIAGRTRASIGLATNDAYQNYIAGYYDAYMALFNPTGGIIYATYFGGSALDIATGISAGLSGDVYICGLTYSQDNIAVWYPYQLQYEGYGDAFLVCFVDMPSGISQSTHQNINNLTLYPNPVLHAALNIDINTSSSGPASIAIYDISGRIMYNGQYSLKAGTQLLQINTGQLPPGSYLVKIGMQDEVITRKIIAVK